MKAVFLFIYVLLSFANGHAQYMVDTYQPDSVYRSNNIRSRVVMYDHNKYKTCYVDNFDHNGRVKEHIRVDTSGKGFSHKTVYEYDSAGNLVKETEFVRKNKINKDLLIFYTAFEYDEKGRFSKKVSTDANGKLNLVDSFTYSPYTLLSKFYDSSGNLTLQEKVVFDRRHIELKRIGFYMHGDTLKRHWDYDFINHFDGSGKIISRRVVYADVDDVDLDHTFYYRQVDYKYNAGGLMIKRISSDPSNNSDHKMALLFDYKFWD